MTSLRQTLHSPRTMGGSLVDNRAGQYQRVVTRSLGGTFHKATFFKGEEEAPVPMKLGY